MAEENLTPTEWLGVGAVGLGLAYGAHRLIGPGSTGDRKVDAVLLGAGALVYAIGVGFGARIPREQLGAAAASGALLYAAGVGIGSTRPEGGWLKPRTSEEVELSIPTDQDIFNAIPTDQEIMDAIPTDQDIISTFEPSGKASEPEPDLSAPFIGPLRRNS